MHDPQVTEPDYGTGEKQLNIYIFGFIACIFLTLLSFWVVNATSLKSVDKFFILYFSAFFQFIIQLFCFIRLNTKTAQGRLNIMSFIFTIVVLITILAGTLWIMWNLNYNMVH